MSDDLKKQLEQLGLDAGQWNKTAGGSRLPPILERQKAFLEKTRDLLTQQVNQDQAQIAELRETLQRVKHGGGQ